MQKINIKKQIRKLYMVTTVGYFQIAGASWVALLALRGFSLVEIGILESIFHIVSLCFEIPSGVVADVIGRKKTMVLSQIASIISSVIMIVSSDFWSIALAMAACALGYNLSSGTREALAYDSLKDVGQEEEYNHFAATEMMLYRITNSSATLLAGVALLIGYKAAYSVDVVLKSIALIISLGLVEVTVNDASNASKAAESFKNVVVESYKFLVENKKARSIMMLNALVGAISTLLLFFLQAKLPLVGLHDALLGPALFFMGLGAAAGSKFVSFFPNSKYGRILLISGLAVIAAFASSFTNIPWIMIIGGFVGSFADDFLEVRTDVILNEMIPSEQRATLISVGSCAFSIVMVILSPIMGAIMG